MSKHSSDSPDHPQKKALDAFGADPLNPNDEMLKRIVAEAKGGEPDELVERWAAAFNEICLEPMTPDAKLLAQLATGGLDKKQVDEILGGAATTPLPVSHRLAAMKEKK